MRDSVYTYIEGQKKLLKHPATLISNIPFLHGLRKRRKRINPFKNLNSSATFHFCFNCYSEFFFAKDRQTIVRKANKG